MGSHLSTGVVNKESKLPEFFRPLFWSYNFDSLNPELNPKTIILNAINYGSLKHWSWLKEHYGSKNLKEILKNIPATELKKRAGRLAEILFDFKLNYAPRGTH